MEPEDLAREVEALRARIPPPSDPVPPRLYHYTSPAGLVGILGGGDVWFTNLRYMNDFAELDHAFALLDRTTQAMAEESADPAVREFLAQVRRHGDPFQELVDAYAFCLSADGDRVGQWREYAGKGTGFAIGVDTARLRLDARGDAHALDAPLTQRHPALMKVVYDEAQQEARIRELLDAACDLARRCPPEARETLLPRLLANVAGRLARLATVFKHPVFEDEKEWRLVLVATPDEAEPHLTFRPTRNVIVPYLLVPCRPDPDQPPRIPVAEIVQGPQVAPDLAERSLRQLLRQRGLHAQVTRSRVPLRF